MDKSDGHIKLDHPPTKDILDRMIRAYYPWPSVWTKIRIRNKELRIKFLPEKRVQLEGKKPILIKDFLNGYPEIKLQLEKLL
jgi:methionyl-tRNA formyltransferase